MKESYGEGIANHPGPEPCEGSRKAALEALDRGNCRLGIELRNQVVRGADGVRRYGRQQRALAITRARRGPAESKTPSMQGKLHAREPGDPAVARAGSERAGRRRR